MHDSGPDSSKTRWIGNFGLGQRWFPFAQGEDVQSADYDAGNLMLGYNAFFDYDLTRDHQRGGIGAEAQYDWFRLASNYYFPLSGWKGSEDFDSAFVEERAAEGWDARIKAYLPFYRNVALTGAYSQWFGDHVGMFGHENLGKDPKVWSYGLEYTPIPLVSGFVTQKSTERGRTDTEFGLNFTYHFGMPWDDQTSHSKVAELRTVGGSRHEFVDRENKIILEYRAKNAYRIEYLGMAGTNAFRFRILDGFDKVKAGLVVTVTAGGGVTLAEAPMPEAGQAGPEQSFLARIGGAMVDFFSVSTAHAADVSQTYTTDGKGEFVVTVGDTPGGSLTLAVRAGNNSQSFTVNTVSDASGAIYRGVSGHEVFTDGTHTTAKITVQLLQNDTPYATQTEIKWEIASVDNSKNQAVTHNGSRGLNWGKETSSYYPGTTVSKTSSPLGEAEIELTDILGERTIGVRAFVVIDGQTVTVEQDVTFGKGPLSKFRFVKDYSEPVYSKTWKEAAVMCSGKEEGYFDEITEDNKYTMGTDSQLQIG